ncbi:MAG: PCMD domain-containing protein [Bacteroidales bacterium]|jgi:hypothetical protein|nr:PCMD domain-containing protein [Bacteroidales bacterium]
MKKLISILLSGLVVLSACDEEKSSKNDIVNFTITTSSYTGLDQETKQINTVEKKVIIAISNAETDNIFPLTITPEITVSSGATINPLSGTSVTFNNPDDFITYEVTSEDGGKSTWTVQLINKQLQNTDFQNWYTINLTSSVEYKEVGLSANSTIWASANPGTSSYSVYNTQPYVLDEDTLVRIKTDQAGQIPIAAGTLFTGKFNLAGAITNPTDPKKATDFGVPYFWRPVSMKFLFKYTAGETYIKATLRNPGNLFGGFDRDTIAGADQCNIYAILEKTTDTGTLLIARADFISGTTADFAEQTIDFVYSSSEIPNQITVVFTSSKDGDLWTGAQGSELIIDDLELLY